MASTWFIQDVLSNCSSHTLALSHYTKTLSNPNKGLLREISVVHGNINSLSPKVRAFVEASVALCQPEQIHICDGTETENSKLVQIMQHQGTIVPLSKYDNCWLARTNPADVARVESKTFICTPDKRETIPKTRDGVKGCLGNWISPVEMDKAIQQRFPGCMIGRTMYVIPFSMGPITSPLSKIGIEITDSPYVVSSMRIMSHMGTPVLDSLSRGADFVKCLHSVGTPTSNFKQSTSWPCDPKRTIILHKPATNEIVSYGSGYGGNSLLGKKCLALRIGSTIAKQEGWLAEHMLIVGITSPGGKKRYIAAAFPSACGKTNLAMMTPSLPGYKVECVGDDIAWMKFDSKGQLRAINPENGFFGVAPGTSNSTNPNAMKTIFKNTIFTNVAATSDGGVFWEGMEGELSPGVKITDWLGQPWNKSSGQFAAHPNSRVLDWILRRIENEDIAQTTAIGYIPKADSLRLEGISKLPDLNELFSLPKDFWLQEVEDIARYFDEQVGEDLPNEIADQLKSLKQRVNNM
uniref:Phosphoenolpyruvate carboxykinase [GTP] n=1 Tax=Timema genevievae TaxID=629358 RepID=A0A7R9PKW7_TIMGE|nr:unnamed protein product [Timema genevievae]